MAKLMGRPSLLTPELQKQICDLLAEGNFVESACDAVGLSKQNFYCWMRWGDPGDEETPPPGFKSQYASFHLSAKAAMATAETAALEQLKKGNMGWQSSAWFLERRYPERWGARRHAALNLNVDLTTLPDEVIERLAQGEEVDLAAISGQGRTGKT